MEPDLVFSLVALRNVLDRLFNNDGPFQIGLGTNDLVPTVFNELGDFIEASYPGYARSASGMPVAGNDCPSFGAFNGYGSFAIGGPTSGPPVNVYTAFFIDADLGPDLLMSFRLPGAPITLSSPTDVVAFAFGVLAAGPQPPVTSLNLIIPSYVNVGGGDYLSPFTATVEALDANGYVATNYTGSVSFSGDGGTPIPITLGSSPGGPPTPFGPLVEGVGTFVMAFSDTLTSVMTNVNVTVTDGLLSGSSTINANAS